MSPELTTWLGQQHLWLFIAAERLLANSQLSDADIAELVEIIKDPTRAAETPPRGAIPARAATDAAELRLVSIGPVEGIDALSPRFPLTFGHSNLAVVYGNNGSGKSGYTRIISKACAKPHVGNLRSNVFCPPPARQVCRIKYSIGGVETEVDWTPAAPLEALSVVDVFDTTSGRIYLENETEVAFMPPELALLADLVSVCGRVEAVLSAEERTLVSTLPAMPVELGATAAAAAFGAISHTTREADVAALTRWTDQDVQDLAALNATLAIADPAVAAQRRRAVKRQRESLAHAIEQAAAQLTGSGLEVTRSKVIDAEDKRRVAREAAAALREKAAVDGVGSDTWRALWNAAREFAINEAFPFEVFPKVAPGDRCVLCHQELDDAARERFTAFESYVSGKVETDAATAERALAEHLRTIVSRPPPETLQTSAQAAELDAPLSELMEQVWAELEQNLQHVRVGAIPAEAFLPSEALARVTASLRALAAEAETEAEALSRSANPDARRADEVRRREMQARKWVSEQAVAIRVEVERKKRIHAFQHWKRETATTGLSRKAGELSETLVTDAYIRRFNTELVSLGASSISVELVKIRAERGRAKHLVRLRNTIAPGARIGDVLSEGERRIISLAAFLADVTGRNGRSPFIFDDPISSLDQAWEERTIDRLIALSASRQVIVFTHRLSLLGILTDKAEDLDTIHIRRESWGTGEPGEIPLAAKRPERALTDLKERRLARARRTLNDEGTDAYYPLAKAICSDLRILTERLVEFVLLADVVQRHRRAVNTQGKIHHLAKISTADCSLIDEMMTKYSRYEHSQSEEAPVELPPPDEIMGDIDRLVAWHTEFTRRTL